MIIELAAWLHFKPGFGPPEAAKVYCRSVRWNCFGFQYRLAQILQQEREVGVDAERNSGEVVVYCKMISYSYGDESISFWGANFGTYPPFEIQLGPSQIQLEFGIFVPAQPVLKLTNSWRQSPWLLDIFRSGYRTLIFRGHDWIPYARQRWTTLGFDLRSFRCVPCLWCSGWLSWYLYEPFQLYMSLFGYIDKSMKTWLHMKSDEICVYHCVCCISSDTHILIWLRLELCLAARGLATEEAPLAPLPVPGMTCLVACLLFTSAPVNGMMKLDETVSNCFHICSDALKPPTSCDIPIFDSSQTINQVKGT